MKLLSLPRYGSLGASSRVRFRQYRPILERQLLPSARFDESPLLSDEYLLSKYAGSVDGKLVVAGYAKRVADILRRQDADLYWIEKELFPWAPAWFERSLLRRPYVLDFDDAIFHNYDLHRNVLVRRLWGRKIDALMREAALVTAGNNYLAERARRAGAEWIEILPTVVDLCRYSTPGPPREVTRGQAVVIGWIGSPATVRYLQEIAAPLVELAAQMPIELRVIGARFEVQGLNTTYVPWTEADEVAAIASCDIGVMPLPDSPWERGKCGYKLIQYMACGLPVVGSPVGVNRDIIQDNVNGYQARNAKDWLDGLAALSADPDRRRRLGLQGRQLVEQRYSIQATAPSVARWLTQLTRSKG